MTKEEYKNKLHVILTESRKRIQNHQKDFALSNNPYKKGDIVSDHYKSIRIEGLIGVHTDYYGIPSLIYYGIVLKKDGTPAKNQLDNKIYQTNIKL